MTYTIDAAALVIVLAVRELAIARRAGFRFVRLSARTENVINYIEKSVTDRVFFWCDRIVPLFTRLDR